MDKLVVLTGYTGVGKTEISIKLAKMFDAEIVSCDSLLIYKQLDIGTAKPTIEERQKVPHHCIDIVEPDIKFDVHQYILRAKSAIADITKRKKNVLIVGGTGFYLKSFFSPVIDSIAITPEAENFVNNALKNNNNEVLVQKLLDLNNGEVFIDLKNIRRVSSALKRCLSSGMTYNEMRKAFQQQRSAFDEYKKFTILLTRNDEDLKERIRKRVNMMLQCGLIDEVENLLKNKKFNTTNQAAIGYRETIKWLTDPTTTTDSLAEEIYHNTLKLVKKQKTWFKKQVPIDLSYNLSNKNMPTICDDLSEKIDSFWHV